MDELRPSDEELPPRSSTTASRGHERVPPHSLEAEGSVLGACLLSQRAATDVSAILRPDDFYRSAHGTLFEGILALRHQGMGIDSITLTEWLRTNNRLGEVGGAAAVHELAQAVPTAANAEYYAKIVRDKALLRRLIDVASQMAQLGFEPTDDVQAVLDRAESLVFQLNEQGTVNDFAELKELLDEAYVAIEERADRADDVTGLRTGFVDLDKLTAGLQPSNLIIVAARPAMGKSSLALSIARFVAVDQKKPAMLFSLEMSRREIVERLLSAQARIDSTKIRVGRLEQNDWTKLADALGDLSDAPLFIDDTPSITMMEIQSKCRQLKHKRGLELVIVDYLQLMQSHRSVDNRQQEVAEISRGLKRLAMDLEVPVIALSQLSRQPEARTDKRPVLSDLRESGCLTAGMRLIRTDTGEQMTIGEMAAGDVRDVPVLATDTDGRLVPGRVLKSFPSGIKESFRVRLRSGRVVEASANHPFRTFDGWTALEHLGVGSRVASVRRFSQFHGSASGPDPQRTVRDIVGFPRDYGTLAFQRDRGAMAARLETNATTLAPRMMVDASSDLFWDEISEITSLGEQPVFDVTVEEHHNFVAEGIVLHNSIEQDADLVAFIYRDEVYHEDSEDMGLAELIVAKHRNGPVRTVRLAFLNHLTQFANLARGGGPPARGPGPGPGDEDPPPRHLSPV